MRHCTFVPPPPPPIVIDDSSLKNAAESFTIALTLTVGGYESAIAPENLSLQCFQALKLQFLISLNFDRHKFPLSNKK